MRQIELIGRPWPTAFGDASLLLRLARAGNLAANIMAGTTGLYSDAVPTATASACLLRAEALVAGAAGAPAPFAWSLVRPPWTSPASNKAEVMAAMRRAVEAARTGTPAGEHLPRQIAALAYSVGHMLRLDDTSDLDSTAREAAAMDLYRVAAHNGCAVAADMLQRVATDTNDDAAQEEAAAIFRTHAAAGLAPHNASYVLQWGIRRLRASPISPYLSAAAAGDCALFQAAFAYGTVPAWPGVPAEPSEEELGWMKKEGRMRTILVDWLVEVNDLKNYGRQTLYAAAALVDSLLQRKFVTRKTLQLAGIAAMVTCARLLEAEVITVREAAWLTNNTYEYNDVVHMLSTLVMHARGQLLPATHLDYTLFLLAALGVAPPRPHEGADLGAARMYATAHLASDLVLLRLPVGRYPPALLAAAIVTITRLTLDREAEVWPARLAWITGLSTSAVISITRTIHAACFAPGPVVDNRGLPLRATHVQYTKMLRSYIALQPAVDHGPTEVPEFAPIPADELAARLDAAFPPPATEVVADAPAAPAGPPPTLLVADSMEDDEEVAKITALAQSQAVAPAAAAGGSDAADLQSPPRRSTRQLSRPAGAAAVAAAAAAAAALGHAPARSTAAGRSRPKSALARLQADRRGPRHGATPLSAAHAGGGSLAAAQALEIPPSPVTLASPGTPRPRRRRQDA
jgi:hypothetical protein